jgi:hypothetical protein
LDGLRDASASQFPNADYLYGADSIRASDRYAELADSAKKKAEQEVARMAA